MDYERPEIEEAWCEERRRDVAAYAAEHLHPHAEIGDWPAWHVAPHVAVWAIESPHRPGRVSAWVISGDLPTDHLDGSEAETPREAVRAFARRWSEAAPLLALGEAHPEVGTGRTPDQRKSLAPLLASRAAMLARWADYGEMWES